MGKQIATCGHEVSDGGIAFSTNGFTKYGKGCSDYKTYCAKCMCDLLCEYNSYQQPLQKTEIGKFKDLFLKELGLTSTN